MKIKHVRKHNEVMPRCLLIVPMFISSSNVVKKCLMWFIDPVFYRNIQIKKFIASYLVCFLLLHRNYTSPQDSQFEKTVFVMTYKKVQAKLLFGMSPIKLSEVRKHHKSSGKWQIRVFPYRDGSRAGLLGRVMDPFYCLSYEKFLHSLQ